MKSYLIFKLNFKILIMKKVLFGLVSLFLASQLFVSCSSENDIMSQFSKRKYLKKTKSKNVKYEDNINKHDNQLDYMVNVDEYASSVEPTEYQLDEIEVVDNFNAIELEAEKEVQLNLIKEVVKDYSDWNKYNRQMNFSNMDVSAINRVTHNDNISSSQVNEVVIAILCIFIPPLAVYLYEDSITTNFWIDLICTLLFWIPGIVVAFLICFGGVSF